MTFASRSSRLALLTVALAALLLAGCGEKQAKTLEGKEGERLDIGGLVYQVQLSRILNPRDVEDEEYTRNLPAPRPSEAFYGVFMRVDNEESKKPRGSVPLEAMRIVDAGGNEFHPIPVGRPGLSYEAAVLEKGQRLPVPDSAGDNYPTKGNLILFKLPYETLDNRPLKLEIEGPRGEVGEVDLDV